MKSERSGISTLATANVREVRMVGRKETFLPTKGSPMSLIGITLQKRVIDGRVVALCHVLRQRWEGGFGCLSPFYEKAGFRGFPVLSIDF